MQVVSMLPVADLLQSLWKWQKLLPSLYSKRFACDNGSQSQLRQPKSNAETQQSGFGFQRGVQKP